MKYRTLLSALALGASAVVSCMVYDPSDLTGTGDAGQSGVGAGGGGATGRGGEGMGGTLGGSAGMPPGTGGSASSGGEPTMTGGGGSGSPTGGRMGDGGAGEGGQPGGAPPTGGTMTGGSGGTTAGTGGAPVKMTPKTLIDDFEDQNHRIENVEDPKGVRRNGFWYTYANGTYEKLEPPPGEEFVPPPHPEGVPGPPGIESEYALQLVVAGVPLKAGNGAAVAFNFLEPKAPYDASRYVGIAFWARASSEATVSVKIVTRKTDEDGGFCTQCFDHFFKEVTVGTSWQLHQGFWDDRDEFVQEGWGTDASPFEESELMGVQFFVPANEIDDDPEFELWLDDISFVEPEDQQ